MAFLDKVKKEFKGKKKIVRNKDTGTPLVRYFKSFCHAIDGLIYSFICEHNMIIIFVASIVTITFGFLLQINTAEWLFCILVMGTIAASELINTAIEAVVDLASPDIHPLAKIAKDTASSATLILCISALVGGLVIFIPKIIELVIVELI